MEKTFGFLLENGPQKIEGKESDGFKKEEMGGGVGTCHQPHFRAKRTKA